jgi:hypothetical protein
MRLGGTGLGRHARGPVSGGGPERGCLLCFLHNVASGASVRRPPRRRLGPPQFGFVLPNRAIGCDCSIHQPMYGTLSAAGRDRGPSEARRLRVGPGATPSRRGSPARSFQHEACTGLRCRRLSRRARAARPSARGMPWTAGPDPSLPLSVASIASSDRHSCPRTPWTADSARLLHCSDSQALYGMLRHRQEKIAVPVPMIRLNLGQRSSERRAHADRGALWAVTSAVRFAGARQSEHPSKSPKTQRSDAEAAVTQWAPGLS